MKKSESKKIDWVEKYEFCVWLTPLNDFSRKFNATTIARQHYTLYFISVYAPDIEYVHTNSAQQQNQSLVNGSPSRKVWIRCVQWIFVFECMCVRAQSSMEALGWHKYIDKVFSFDGGWTVKTFASAIRSVYGLFGLATFFVIGCLVHSAYFNTSQSKWKRQQCHTKATASRCNTGWFYFKYGVYESENGAVPTHKMSVHNSCMASNRRCISHGESGKNTDFCLNLLKTVRFGIGEQKFQRACQFLVFPIFVWFVYIEIVAVLLVCHSSNSNSNVGWSAEYGRKELLNGFDSNTDEWVSVAKENKIVPPKAAEAQLHTFGKRGKRTRHFCHDLSSPMLRLCFYQSDFLKKCYASDSMTDREKNPYFSSSSNAFSFTLISFLSVI